MAQDNLAISISFVEDAKHNITDLSKRFNALLKNTTLKVNVTGDALDELKKITKAVKTLNTTMGNVKLQAPVDVKKVKEASAGISALEKDVERLKTSFATAQAELEKLGNAKASRSNEISLLDKEIEKYDKLIASAKEYEKATYKSLRDVAQGQRDRYIQQGQNADAAITQKRNELLKITENLAQKEKELEAARSAGGKTSTAKERLELLKNIDKSITDISNKLETISSKGPVKIVDPKTAVDVAKLAEELKKVGDVTAGMQTTKGGADMHMLRRYVEFSNIIKTLVQQFSEFIPLLQNTNFSSLATSLTEASRAMSSLAVNVQNVGQNMAHNFSAGLSGEINKITEEAVKAGRALDELGQKKESNAKYNFTKDFSVADALGKIEAYQRMLKEVNDLIKRTQSRGKDTSQLEDYKRRITEIIDALKRLRDSGGTVAQSIFSNMTTKQFMNSTASNAKELRELWKSYKDGLKLDKSSEDAKNQLNKLSKKFQDLIDLRDRLSKLNLDTSQAENALKGLKTLMGSLSAIQLNGKKNGMLYSDFMGQYSSKKAIAQANDAMREGRRAVREREREEAAADRQRLNSLSQIERKLQSLAALEQKIKNSGALQSDTTGAAAVKKQYAEVQKLIAAYEQLRNAIGNVGGMQFKQGGFGGQLGGLNKNLSLIKQNSADALGGFAREQRAASRSTSDLTTRQQMLSNAIQQANQSAKGQSQILSDLRNMASQYLSVWGAMNFVKEVAQVTGELELQRKSLEVIIGNASYARNLYADIRDLSQQSPYNFQDLMKSTRQLAAFGVQTKDLYGTMKSLSDIGAGLSVDVSRLILAYGHTKSYGYLSGIQNRQFETAGIDMVGGLVDHYNKLAKAASGAGEQIDRVSRKDVFKMIHDKEVSFEDVNAVIMGLDRPGGKFYNMQERQYDTIGGKLRNLRNNYTIMLSEIGESHKGILKWGVDGLNELTAHWEKYANVLAMVLVPLGALKLANMAFTSSLTRQSRQVSASMKNWVKDYRRSQIVAANLKSFYADPNLMKKKWIPTRGERKIFADNLRKRLGNFEMTRSDAIRLGFSRSLPSELRRIALGLGGVDKATQKTILSGNILEKTWARVKLSFFNIGNIFRSVGNALKGLFSTFVQMAPMMALTAIFEHVSKVASDAETVASKFRDTGSNDRKELADLMQRYVDQMGDANNDQKADVSITKNWSNGRRYNTLNVDKEALRSAGIDLTDEINEIKEKMQAMDPLVDVNLFDINKMTDQYDQFESLLQRVETLRRVNEAKESAAPSLEKAITESAGDKVLWIRWGDTIVTNMQEAVDEYNSLMKDMGDLTDDEIRSINDDWDGFLQDKANAEGYESLRDALTAVAREYSVTTDGAKKLKDAIIEAGNPTNIEGNGKSKDFIDWLKDGRVQMKQAEKDIRKFGKELAAIARSQNFKKDVFEIVDGKKMLKTIDDVDAYALFIKEEIKALQDGLKGNGEETGYHFTTSFIESTIEGLKNYGFKDDFLSALSDQLNMDRLLPMIKQMAGEQRIDMDKTYSEEEINKLAEDMKWYMIDKGGDFQEVGEKYAEFILKGLKIILKTDGGEKEKVLEDWQKDLIRQLENNEINVDAEVITNVKSKLIKDVKDSDSLMKFWQETIKKEYDAAKSYIESQPLLLQNTIKWRINSELNFGDISQLQKMLSDLRTYKNNAEKSTSKTMKDQIPYIETLIKQLEMFIGISALADKNNQNFAQNSRDDWQKKQQEKANKIKQDQDRVAREAKQKADEAKRKAEQAAKEAHQKAVEAQREELEQLRERVRLIREAHNEYKKLVNEGWLKRDALASVNKKFADDVKNKRILQSDIDGVEKMENTLRDVEKIINNKKWFSELTKDVHRFGTELKKSLFDIDMTRFKDQQETFTSSMENSLNRLTKRWQLFESVWQKAGSDVALKFTPNLEASKNNDGNIFYSKLNNLGQMLTRGSEDWSAEMRDTFDWFNNLLKEVGDDVARSATQWLADATTGDSVKERKELTAEAFSKMADALNFGQDSTDRKRLYALIPAYAKAIEEFVNRQEVEETAAIEKYAELIGNQKGILTQRKKIEEDYKKTVSDLESGNLTDEQKEKGKTLAKDRRDYELFLLSQEYQQYMNAVETLTVDEVRRSAEFIRAQLAEAFQKGIIDANTFTEQNKEVTERLNQNLPYNLPLVGNGRKAIYEQVGRWFFDPTSEKNRAALQNWQGDVSRRLDNEQSKKKEEQDENLIAALDLLADLLNRILSGTATQKDKQLAGELGGVIAGWGTVNTSTKDRIIRQAKENKEQHDEDEQNGKASKKIVTFAEAVKWATDALEKLQEGLDYFSGFFKSIGMKGASNALSDASTVVGSTLGGAKTLQGLASSIAPSLGPYGAAAGAALGVISGIAQANDARHQRNIENLRHDVQKIDNTLNLIRKLRESGLGYDDGSLRRQLAAQAAASGDKVMADYYARGGLSGTGYAQEIQALKKQREDYMSMYDEENAKKDKSREDLEEYKTKVAELDVQIRDYSQNLAKELWSIDIKGWASQIGDALMTAFENGTNAAAAFRDSVQDIMRSVVKSMMIKGILEPAFEKVFDKMFGKNGTFDENNPQVSLRPTLDVLTKFFDEDLPPLVTVAKEFYEGANNIAEQNLGYGLDSKDSSKNLTNSITSTASEETMGIVAGYLSALRQDVGVNRIMLTGFMNESWPSYIEIVTKANNSLTAVDRNTEQIMTMMRDGQGALYERVERMSRRIDNFATGIDRLHTA